MGDKDLRSRFSRNLLYFLSVNGCSQADMARAMKVSTATAAKWCNGQSIPRIDKLQSLSLWLGIGELQLFDADDSSKEIINEIVQRETFSKKLRYYVRASKKTQKQVAEDIGCTYTTFNSWTRGTAMPNVAKIQIIANYFGIERSMLLGDDKKSVQADYLTDDSIKIAQRIHSDFILRDLFNAAENANPDDIKMVTSLLSRLKMQTSNN